MKTLLLLIALGHGHFHEQIVYSSHTEHGVVSFEKEGRLNVQVNDMMIPSSYTPKNDILIVGEMGFRVEKHGEDIWLIPLTETPYEKIILKRD